MTDNKVAFKIHDNASEHNNHDRDSLYICRVISFLNSFQERLGSERISLRARSSDCSRFMPSSTGLQQRSGSRTYFSSRKVTLLIDKRNLNETSKVDCVRDSLLEPQNSLAEETRKIVRKAKTKVAGGRFAAEQRRSLWL